MTHDKLKIETIREPGASMPVSATPGMFDLCANLKAPLAIPPHETRVGAVNWVQPTYV
jgi:hypothetical protein